MRALFANYAHLCGFVLLTIGNQQWKKPSKSTPVTEGDYSANIKLKSQHSCSRKQIIVVK